MVSPENPPNSNATVMETTGCPPVHTPFKTDFFFGHMACADLKQDHHLVTGASL